jgi:uncharacterized protein
MSHPSGSIEAVEKLSLAQARRIALAAQGFCDPRPAGQVGARHFDRVLDRVALLQLDSVNVLCRSHYLPVFARLGPYPRDALDRYAWGPLRHRRLFEYWGHMASLLPWRLHPYLRWRMARARTEVWTEIVKLAERRPGLVEEVRRLVHEQGPVVGGSVEVERRPKVPGAMWNWHDGKIALEWLFSAGEVTCAARVNFERSYDLTERVFPPQVLAVPTPPDDEAHRELIRIAARAHGVGTERDLRDYFRQRPRFSKPAVADLVGSGELLPVAVQGWPEPAYLWHEARLPRRVRARALLSPFDSLVWERDRTERLFDFRYRIEIYVPAAKRVYGYYVLPFLLGDRLVARVDLKADRQVGVLRVQAAYAEPGADAGEVAGELAASLAELAEWLGLSGVVVLPRGDLAGTLAVAVAVQSGGPAALAGRHAAF